MVPSLFLAHGSPMLAMEDNQYTRFLNSLGEQIHPKAIVIFSAHWESEVLTISYTDDEYETIYDFYGFPDELYAIKYPAKGSKEVANIIEKRLEATNIKVQRDHSRGLDHGSWTLLSKMYPKADIPVIQVSVHPFLSPEDQYKIGSALKGLGKEDILVIGSGVTVHNLRMVNWGSKTPEPWAIQFDDWLIEKVENNDLQSLFHYEQLAPNAKYAVPRPEHFVPFYIALGSGEDTKKAKIIYRSYEFGTLSYLCYQF
ncbi:DODA-type extradiol aromatic ring-opening family dioxygenase [Bacillus massilinigeriensis]|uniref:DODA-type extradiol aromatic ring-opening family dioxygenase n=1 Tax=Bacillus massilionigeriensis TaxID=1805475 RepID=UPI00096B4CDD|nr:class III extradiol ring-cleavage dioxygenase [Bacillus massilionigeriensis]